MTKKINPLYEFFLKNESNAIHKWMHYFDIYERHFSSYKNSDVTILEIGVYQGGSLNMWRDYFGASAKIFAIDINPDCKQFETDNTKIFIGSQADRGFLREVKSQIPRLDIIIDDGGHSMEQQIVSFEELYGHVQDEGLYLIEDLHTSYWKSYGGGYKNPQSFLEYSKGLIDLLHAWHFNKSLSESPFAKSTYGMHFYDSILVFEKKIIMPPEHQVIGNVSIDLSRFPLPGSNSI